MPDVRLRRYEAEDGELPRICLRCGASASVTRSKNFSWYPPWVIVLILAGVVPFAIVAMVLTKRMRLQAPLCPQHKGHWFNRNLFIVLGALALVILGVASIVLMASLDKQPGPRNNLAGFLCLGVGALGLVWLIAVVIVQATAIRPREITDREMTLMGVAREFVDALDEYRQQARKQRRDEDDQYRPPPRLRASEGGDEGILDPERRWQQPRGGEDRFYQQ
jgi:hypothetical protein